MRPAGGKNGVCYRRVLSLRLNEAGITTYWGQQVRRCGLAGREETMLFNPDIGYPVATELASREILGAFSDVGSWCFRMSAPGSIETVRTTPLANVSLRLGGGDSL